MPRLLALSKPALFRLAKHAASISCTRIPRGITALQHACHQKAWHPGTGGLRAPLWTKGAVLEPCRPQKKVTQECGGAYRRSANRGSTLSASITESRHRTPTAGPSSLFQPSSTSGSLPEEKADVVVIGAGVIGLAIARRLALSGREVLILEAASAFGTGTSSRNSEVIHAGLYYETGSLNARLCVEGNKRLYEFAKEHDVSYKQYGKLVVACKDHEIPKLKDLYETAQANGVTSLEWLSLEDARRLEPDIHCAAALLSTSTGVIDSHGLMAALLAEAESHGAVVAYNSTISSGKVASDHIMLEVTDSTKLKEGDSSPSMRLHCSAVINAAGLDAQAIAKCLGGFPTAHVPRRYLARGNYFSLSGGKSPFSHLVYPIPPEGGLGVHVTVDLGGQCKFGPDVEWLQEDMDHPIASYDYTVNPERAASFYSAIREYYPGLPDDSLEPAYSGIRPKLFGPGEADVGSKDFLIQGPETHGIPGLVNLFGIESPGLTSCLPIADKVAEKLTK